MSSSSPAPPAKGPGLWIRTTRAPFLTASGMPAVLGASAASWHTGVFAPDRFLLTLAGVLCVHLGANVANDYYDYVTGADTMNPDPTQFSGGSRVIQDGLVSARVSLVLALGFLAAGFAMGLVLNSMVPGNKVILMGAAGILCGFLYSAVPVKLSYRGLGEIVIFVAFGPLTVMGAYLCQTGRLDRFAFLVSIPAGLLVLGILLVNEVLDLEWDGKAGKRTLAVRLGKDGAYRLFLGVYLAAFAAIVALMAVRRATPYAAFAVAPAALALHGLRPARALAARPALVNASRLTILTQIAATGLLAVSYFA
jgi:1,4-dihydroxy-2-naphthoate octaprenyltransferase